LPFSNFPWRVSKWFYTEKYKAGREMRNISKQFKRVLKLNNIK